MLAAVTQTVHLVAAGLWAGVVAMTAVSAAILFPTIRDLEPTLAAYPEYTGEHWRLGAGLVASKLFFAADIVQLAGIVLTGASLLTLVAMGRFWDRKVLAMVRLLGFGLAAVSLGAWMFAVGPEMWTNLNAYHAAASEGANDAAAQFQQAFNDAHPTASNLMGATLVGVLIMFVSAAWSAASQRSGGDRP